MGLQTPLTATETNPLRGNTSKLKSVLAHRGALTLFDQIVVSLTNFSTGILIGRFCSKDELGLYMLGYSVILFAIALQQMMVSSPYILTWPRLSGKEALRYTNGAFVQQFGLGAVLAISLLIASLAFHHMHSRLWLVMLTYAVAGPLLLFKEMFRRVCFTQLRVTTAVILDLVVGALQVLILAELIHTHHLSAPNGILAAAAAGSTLLLSWMWRKRSVFRIDLRDAKDVLRQNWHLGRWIFGSQILWAGSMYSYPWLVSHFHGNGAAGVWAACFGINALGNPLLLGLQNFIEPKVSHAFASGGYERMRTLVWKSAAVATGSMLLFSLFIGVVGNRVAVLLYGPKYAGNEWTILLLTLSFAAGAAGFPFSCGFFASGHGNLDLRISWIYPIALCLCGVPLVHAYGPVGGAISLLVANTISSILRATQFLFTVERSASTVAIY